MGDRMKHQELRFLAGEVKNKETDYQFGAKLDKTVVVVKVSKN